MTESTERTLGRLLQGMEDIQTEQTRQGKKIDSLTGDLSNQKIKISKIAGIVSVITSAVLFAGGRVLAALGI